MGVVGGSGGSLAAMLLRPENFMTPSLYPPPLLTHVYTIRKSYKPNWTPFRALNPVSENVELVRREVGPPVEGNG